MVLEGKPGLSLDHVEVYLRLGASVTYYGQGFYRHDGSSSSTHLLYRYDGERLVPCVVTGEARMYVMRGYGMMSAAGGAACADVYGFVVDVNG